MGLEVTADVNAIGERLDQIGAILAAQVEREGAREAPDIEVIAHELEALRLEIDCLTGIEESVSSWTGGTVELEREAAVAGENLTLAQLALQRARDAYQGGNNHQLLHLSCDAIFHARRSIDQMRQLEGHALELTRRLDRDENRREFLSG